MNQEHKQVSVLKVADSKCKNEKKKKKENSTHTSFFFFTHTS